MLDMRTITRHWIQKIEKLQEKTIQIIKFLPNNAQVLKEMHRLKIIKLKDFITLQNILVINDYLEEKWLKSFNTIFKQMETNQFHNKGYINAHQLKRHDLKIEKYDGFSILNKCLSDWNLLQNAIKTNFQKIKHLEIKTIVTNHFLEKCTK